MTQGRVTRPLIDNRLARSSKVGGDWLWLGGADLMVADASSLETIGFFELRPSESAWVACSHPSNDAIWIGTNQRLLRIAEKPGRSMFGRHSLESMEIDGRNFEVSATRFRGPRLASVTRIEVELGSAFHARRHHVF